MRGSSAAMCPGRRVVTVLSVVAVLGGACGGSGSDERGSGASPTVEPGSGRPGATPRSHDRVPEAHGIPGDGGSAPVPPAAGLAPPPANAATGPRDDGPTGANGFSYLSDTTPELLVEIDAVSGMAPSASSIELLQRRLRSVVDKPSGIRFLPVETVAGGADTWTLDRIADVEARNRDSYSSGDRAVIYLLFCDGEPQDSRALGLAWRASSVAIFTDRIRDAATPLVGAESIEKAVVVHEIGHLLSLVNLGYRSPRDHEDPDHPSHSDNADSVMYWAIDNVGIATLLGGHTEPPNDFDDDDRADLADVKAGRLGG